MTRFFNAAGNAMRAGHDVADIRITGSQPRRRRGAHIRLRLAVAVGVVFRPCFGLVRFR